MDHEARPLIVDRAQYVYWLGNVAAQPAQAWLIVQLVRRRQAIERDHPDTAFQELGDDASADEPGGAGHEEAGRLDHARQNSCRR